MNLSKADARGDVYMSEGLGRHRAHRHQAQLEGTKEFPFWVFLADLNSVCSFEETFWKGERFLE